MKGQWAKGYLFVWQLTPEGRSQRSLLVFKVLAITSYKGLESQASSVHVSKERNLLRSGKASSSLY